LGGDVRHLSEQDGFADVEYPEQLTAVFEKRRLAHQPSLARRVPVSNRISARRARQRSERLIYMQDTTFGAPDILLSRRTTAASNGGDARRTCSLRSQNVTLIMVAVIGGQRL
jgi:hypothetical protein